MSTDSSGNYSLPEAAIQNGQVADADVVQSNFDDLAAGMTERLTKNGKTTATANLPMGNFRHTSVGSATARTDYARADQVIGSVLDYAIDTGSATAFAIAPSPGISAYVVGQRFAFKANNANSGANPTLAVNSLTAGIIYWPDGTALAAGDIPNDGQIEVHVATVTTGTPTFHLQTPIGDPVRKAGTQTITGAKTFSATLTMSGAAIIEAALVDVASATTCLIAAANTNYVRITGTTTITAFESAPAGTRIDVLFADALTLTYNATSLILPTNANITTVAGDTMTLRSSGSGNWRCVDYMRDDGTPLAISLSAVTNSLTGDVNLNNASNYFDGPSVAQGSTGTWLATGTVTVFAVAYGDEFHAKLWDGTTVIARTTGVWQADGAAVTTIMSLSLSGYLASPAGNLRISVKCSNTGGKILQTADSAAKASTISAVRIA